MRSTRPSSEAMPVTETGRECGTSASSAPSEVTICTPSASARSTTVSEKVRHRIAGSGPESRIRSRGARGTRASWISNSGQSMSRVRPSRSRTVGRVAWKSTNSSGSIVANRSASSAVPRKERAAVADSPASYQPLNAHTRAGALRLSGRRSQRRGCIPVHGSGFTSGARTIIGLVAGLTSLRPGDEIAGVYACTRKDRLLARTGAPYLALELRDRTGALPGRAFKDADVLAGRFDRGELVRVRGRVERFRDELQVEVLEIARAQEADPAEFLPVAYRNVDELDGFLEHLAREVHDPAYSGLLERLLADDALRAEWRRAPCTRGGHHAYLGGLLEHTVAVGTLVVETCVLPPRLNSDLLLTAALVHDLGKTREFTYGAEIGLSEEGRLLGHVVLGQRMIDERSAGMDEARRLALAHCVLTHHGAAAAPGGRFGSPEALALHRLNALDATVKGALQHGLTA